MKSVPRCGTTLQRTFRVETSQAIDLGPGDIPPVLSTPALLLQLEWTARECLAPYLAPGEASVGTEIELKHLAPTPLGAQVRCLTRILHTEGALVDFHVEAHDGAEIIARGFHRRAVIRADRFGRRLGAKQASVAAATRQEAPDGSH